jgi:hypothetical protein
VVECLKVFDHAGFFCGFDPARDPQRTQPFKLTGKWVMRFERMGVTR